MWTRRGGGWLKVSCLGELKQGKETVSLPRTSIADPDPKDPYVLGPPDPDPLVRDTDLDSSIIKQKKIRKTLIPTVLSLL
jgi:hypothetical protein